MKTEGDLPSQLTEMWVVFGPRKRNGWQDKRTIRAYTTLNRAKAAIAAAPYPAELYVVVKFVPSLQQLRTVPERQVAVCQL